MKKKVVNQICILIAMSLTVMSLTACSNKPEASEGATQNVLTEKETTEVEQETENKTDDIVSAEESSVSNQGNNAQVGENIDAEMTTEEILDLFINGSISAISSTDISYGKI
jgi:uncharacterized protein YxeA